MAVSVDAFLRLVRVVFGLAGVVLLLIAAFNFDSITIFFFCFSSFCSRGFHMRISLTWNTQFRKRLPVLLWMRRLDMKSNRIGLYL